MNEEVTSKKILKKLLPWEYKKDENMIRTRNGDKYSIKRNLKEIRKTRRNEKDKTNSGAKTKGLSVSFFINVVFSNITLIGLCSGPIKVMRKNNVYKK
jgi:hypothetical protein